MWQLSSDDVIRWKFEILIDVYVQVMLLNLFIINIYSLLKQEMIFNLLGDLKCNQIK
jgi:hypothetical protein